MDCCIAVPLPPPSHICADTVDSPGNSFKSATVASTLTSQPQCSCALSHPIEGLLALDVNPPLNTHPVRDNEVVVVVAHGLTGGSHESYVRAALSTLTLPINEGGLGLRAVVINSRGCNNSPVITPKLYHVCPRFTSLKRKFEVDRLTDDIRLDVRMISGR